jgi:hypothetical protein
MGHSPNALQLLYTQIGPIRLIGPIIHPPVP